MMDRDEILAKLKEKHLVYGEAYTVQGLYEWTKETGFIKEISEWCVCKNHQIDVYKDGTRFELMPIPIEYFETKNIEKAVDRFIELEEI